MEILLEKSIRIFLNGPVKLHKWLLGSDHQESKYFPFWKSKVNKQIPRGVRKDIRQH